MKKIISQWTFDKLYKKSLGIGHDNGDISISEENTEEFFKRLDKLNDDYIVIGPRVVNNFFRDTIYLYRQRHIGSIGKAKCINHKNDENDYCIINIPRNVTWKTDIFLLIIIRDYLRNFINNSPAIGNCVFSKEQLDPKRKEYYEINTEYYAGKWKELVNKVADEFDELYKMQIKRYDSWEESKWQYLKNKAFKDLAFIYDDLNW